MSVPVNYIPIDEDTIRVIFDNGTDRVMNVRDWYDLVIANVFPLSDQSKDIFNTYHSCKAYLLATGTQLLTVSYLGDGVVRVVNNVSGMHNDMDYGSFMKMYSPRGSVKINGICINKEAINRIREAVREEQRRIKENLEASPQGGSYYEINPEDDSVYEVRVGGKITVQYSKKRGVVIVKKGVNTTEIPITEFVRQISPYMESFPFMGMPGKIKSENPYKLSSEQATYFFEREKEFISERAFEREADEQRRREREADEQRRREREADEQRRREREAEEQRRREREAEEQRRREAADPEEQRRRAREKTDEERRRKIEAAKKMLDELGILTPRDLKLWSKVNHPDKYTGGDKKKREEIDQRFKEVREMFNLVHPDFGFRRAFPKRKSTVRKVKTSPKRKSTAKTSPKRKSTAKTSPKRKSTVRKVKTSPKRKSTVRKVKTSPKRRLVKTVRSPKA